MLGVQLRKGRSLRGQHLAFRGFFKVQAQQLLLAPNDAQLDCGVHLRIAPKVRAYASAGHQCFELVAVFIVAHHAEQRRLRAQRDHVVSHVGGAAKAFFLARHAHHGHGRFR